MQKPAAFDMHMIVQIRRARIRALSDAFGLFFFFLFIVVVVIIIVIVMRYIFA